MRTYTCYFFLVLLLSLSFVAHLRAEERVFVINLRSSIDKSSWHMLQKGLLAAQDDEAELIILRLNTYGGAVDMADSMRTAILNSRIPVWAFVDNQAASAGALISLACDSIYMREGASIGAATVVGGTGEAMPDKYQSFMRSVMRSTAQAKGGRWVLNARGDSVFQYRRSPRIAESMVDPDVVVPGVIDSGKVLTLTAHEAEKLGICDGICESVRGILIRNGMEEATVEVFKPTVVDKFISFMMSPFISAILIMLMIGGIYFELQTPGVGLPLLVAILAGVAFLAPFYVEGLVQHLDIIIFLVGLVLVLLEIFVIPGFGIAGVLGIGALIVGLALAMVDNAVVFSWSPSAFSMVLGALATVLVSLTLSVVGCLALSAWLLTDPRVPALALRSNLQKESGYVGLEVPADTLLGKEGEALTVLRPGGKVRIEGRVYDAIALLGMVSKGEKVCVERIEASQIYVCKSVGGKE